MDVELILDKLESLGYVRLSRKTGNYHQVYCPFHNDGNEKKPSCGVLLVDEFRNGQKYPQGLWHCFACGAVHSMQEAVTIILKNHNITRSGYDWLVENIPGFELDDGIDPLLPPELIDKFTSKLAVDYIQTKLNKKPEYVKEEELAKYRFTVPYMYERKLTDKIIQDYDIGVDLEWIPPGRSKPVPCITFPVRDADRRTLFLVRRSIKGKFFNYPTGVTKPVYGMEMVDQSCKSLIITESCFNALTAVSYGYSAVALLGTGNSYQIDQLRRSGVNEFVLCMDGDDAGRRANSKLKKSLSDIGIIWTVNMPEGRDINDLSKEEFDQLYSMRE